MKNKNIGKIIMGIAVLSALLFNYSAISIDEYCTDGMEDIRIEYNIRSNFPSVPVIVKE